MFGSESLMLKIVEGIPKILLALSNLAKTSNGMRVVAAMFAAFGIFLIYKFIVKQSTVDMNYNRNFNFSVTYPAGSDGKILRVLRDSLEEQVEQIEGELNAIENEIGLKAGQLYKRWKNKTIGQEFFYLFERLEPKKVGSKVVDTKRWKCIRLSGYSSYITDYGEDFFEGKSLAKLPEFDRFYTCKHGIRKGFMRLSEKTKKEILSSRDKKLEKAQKKNFLREEYFYDENTDKYLTLEGISKNSLFEKVLLEVNGENDAKTEECE